MRPSFRHLVAAFALVLFGVQLDARAYCTETDQAVPSRATAWDKRTLDQKIETRKIQIKCREKLVEEARSLLPPRDLFRQSCNSAACEKIYNYCNATKCDDGDCKVALRGDQYCWSVYKDHDGPGHTDCYVMALNSNQREAIGKCWRVRNEKIAERNEGLMDELGADLIKLEKQRALDNAHKPSGTNRASPGTEPAQNGSGARPGVPTR